MSKDNRVDIPAEVLRVSCPTCGAEDWEQAGDVRRMRRGLLKGWNYVCELRCRACQRRISAGWGGQQGWRERRPARRR